MSIDPVALEDALMGPTPKYRLLMDGEPLQVGDEMLCDDAETWKAIGKVNTVCSNWMVGSPYDAKFFMPARRRIDAAKGGGKVQGDVR